MGSERVVGGQAGCSRWGESGYGYCFAAGRGKLAGGGCSNIKFGAATKADPDTFRYVVASAAIWAFYSRHITSLINNELGELSECDELGELTHSKELRACEFNM